MSCAQYCRAAVDFEKKAHSDNLEQSKAMEKNMIAVASEIERLRGELLNAEKGTVAVNPAAAVPNSGIILNLLQVYYHLEIRIEVLRDARLSGLAY
jgi:hypothetical protein